MVNSAVGHEEDLGTVGQFLLNLGSELVADDNALTVGVCIGRINPDWPRVLVISIFDERVKCEFLRVFQKF